MTEVPLLVIVIGVSDLDTPDTITGKHPLELSIRFGLNILICDNVSRPMILPFLNAARCLGKVVFTILDVQLCTIVLLVISTQYALSTATSQNS